MSGKLIDPNKEMSYCCVTQLYTNLVKNASQVDSDNMHILPVISRTLLQLVYSQS